MSAFELSLPRFPQPFLEQLQDSWLLPFRDLLALTSVDRSGEPMRRFVINHLAQVDVARVRDQEQLRVFLSRFPRCAVRQVVKRSNQAILDGVTQLVIGPNVPVRQISLPSSLVHVSFGAAAHVADNGFNQSIAGLALPPGITSIAFGNSYNMSLAGVDWPTALQSLSLGQAFDRPLAAHLPATLRSLTLGWAFSHTLRDVRWPPQLQRLVLSHEFNGSLDDVVLPASLAHLAFGARFNRPLPPGVLSNCTMLHTLRFGDAFDQRIDGCLPPSLTELQFGAEFQQPIATATFAALKLLQVVAFGAKFNCGVTLPASVRHASFGRAFISPLAAPGLVSLTLAGNVDLLSLSMPSSLQRLDLPLFDRSLAHVTLPSGLRTLSFARFNWSLSDVEWPPQLAVLLLGDRFNQSLEPLCALPHLRRVQVGAAFVGTIPPTLMGIVMQTGNRAIWW